MSIPPPQEYQVLTEEQKYKAMRAVNRTKKKAMETGRMQFVLISFEPGDIPGSSTMKYSESHQMPMVKE